jgi:hypothetical protein
VDDGFQACTGGFQEACGRKLQESGIILCRNFKIKGYYEKSFGRGGRQWETRGKRIRKRVRNIKPKNSNKKKQA